MSAPDDFGRAIHTPEGWEQDTYALGAQLEPFQGIKLADITPAISAQLGSMAIAELVHLRDVVRALALERRPNYLSLSVANKPS